MKNVNRLKPSFLMCVALFFLTAKGMAQDKKFDKAEAHFCDNAVSFVEVLQNLEAVYENDAMSEKDFEKAYNQTIVSWDKLVKSADKLEDVTIKESVKSYNDLVDEINKLSGAVKTSQSVDKISENITKTLSQIVDVQGDICE